ncbi:MAG TPA: hypothetical protein VII99_14595 [Bacteroidia bacterium]
MRPKFIYITAFGFIAIELACCSTPLLIPSEQDAARTKTTETAVTLEELKSGHELYIRKCGNCHYLYRPNRFTEEKWKAKIPKMALKAKISGDEQNRVLRYILAMRDAYNEPARKKK